MEKIKKIIKRLFCLPPLPTVLIAVPAFLFVIYVLKNDVDGPLSYAAYLSSAYALVILCTGFPGVVRAVKRYIRNHPLTQKLLGIPIAGRFLNDVIFRTAVTLRSGFLINTLYIAMKLFSGIYYRSVWFVALAVYYALLAVMRFLLLFRVKEYQGRAALRRYRLCGLMLLVMNIALAGIVMLMVHQNYGYEYPGLLIYAMALYAFYAVIIAIVNLVRFRKHKSPILSAAKAINFVAALVSILSLETAMLAQFGGEDGPHFRKMMTGFTGGGVCMIVLGVALVMIIKSSKQLQKLEIKTD